MMMMMITMIMIYNHEDGKTNMNVGGRLGQELLETVKQTGKGRFQSCDKGSFNLTYSQEIAS